MDFPKSIFCRINNPEIGLATVDDRTFFQLKFFFLKPGLPLKHIAVPF